MKIMMLLILLLILTGCTRLGCDPEVRPVQDCKQCNMDEFCVETTEVLDGCSTPGIYDTWCIKYGERPELIAAKNCMLIISTGIKPLDNSASIRTWNLTTDQIEGRTDSIENLDNWKYWITCNKPKPK